MSFIRGSRAVMLALTLATIPAGPKPAYAGGGYGTSYCEEALERNLPFNRARTVWGMDSYQNSEGDIRILLCGNEARVDVVPDNIYYLGFIRVQSGQKEKVEEGKRLLESLGCNISTEGESNWTSEMTLRQHLSVEDESRCSNNFERARN